MENEPLIFFIFFNPLFLLTKITDKFVDKLYIVDPTAKQFIEKVPEIKEIYLPQEDNILFQEKKV